MTQQNNALNIASALAAQRMQQNTQEKTVLGGNLSAQAIQQQINNAADPGQSRLSVFNRMRARAHESRETLHTTKEVITHRETAIRKLAVEAIEAQINLQRAELKQRFDTEYAVISERGMAAFAQAQRSFYAIVDAAADQIHDDFYHRVNDIQARFQAEHMSDVAYQNELVRAQRQCDIQISNLEASCAQRIHTLNTTFNS